MTPSSSASALPPSTRSPPRAKKLQGVEDAVDFIANLRQPKAKATVPVGRRVVVIGGGMTAVDAAIQSKLLGAEEVTMVYRRGKEQMNASEYEQDLASVQGRADPPLAEPREIDRAGWQGSPRSNWNIPISRTAACRHRRDRHHRLRPGVHRDRPEASSSPASIRSASKGGKITVDGEGRTTLDGVWAGGDCVSAATTSRYRPPRWVATPLNPSRASPRAAVSRA